MVEGQAGDRTTRSSLPHPERRLGHGSVARGGLWSVPADGSQDPQPLTSPDPERGEVDHRWPEILPGGQDVLFTITGSTPQESQVAVLTLGTPGYKTLIRGSDARYSPTGHLLYGAEGTLLAVFFDLVRKETIGESFPVQLGVNTKSSGAVNYAFSESGTLAYIPGGAAVQRTLGWVTPDGMGGIRATLVESETLVGMPRISPDGKQAAIVETDEQGNDAIWLRDLRRGESREVEHGRGSSSCLAGQRDGVLRFQQNWQPRSLLTTDRFQPGGIGDPGGTGNVHRGIVVVRRHHGLGLPLQ